MIFDEVIFYNDDIWYSTKLSKDTKIPKYWNGFGCGIKEKGNQIIVVEINFALSGSSKQVAGLFAKDSITGECFVLHRGKVGGGKPGVGKETFRNWYRGKWVEVFDGQGNIEEAILIGSLKSKYLIGRIRDFVKEIEIFKHEVTSGKNSRAPKNINKKLLFDPEFHGTKRGRRKSEFEYESYHGLVVNSLHEQLEKESSTYNDRLIDLAIQRNGKILKIYEVKTALDRQSIYTGIGQLMFHSGGDDKIKKVLVLPSDNYPKERLAILRSLNISVLPYKILNGEKVIFESVLS